MKRTLLLSSLLFCFLVANAQFSGNGSGTSADPYQITNADELSEMRNALSACYQLMNDIDLTEWIEENNPTQGWKPIGTSSAPFHGILNGANHSIRGLYINRPNEDYVGLLGVFYAPYGQDNVPTIYNLNLVKPRITGKNGTGALAGVAEGESSNSHFYINKITVIEPSIEGNDSVGGVVGAIKNCFLNNFSVINPMVVGKGSAGGIAGYYRYASYDWSSEVANCIVNGGCVSAEQTSGGIVGKAINGTEYSLIATIKGNYCSSKVTGYLAGGIVGQADGSGYISSKYGSTVKESIPKIDDNHFAGSIEGTHVGGILASLKDNYLASTLHLRRNICSGKIYGLHTCNGIVGESTYGNPPAHYYDVTNNVNASDTISVSKGQVNPYRISSDERVKSNYGLATTIMVAQGNEYMVSEDNELQGTSYGMRTLKRKSTYIGFGFDFDSQWAINDEKSYPYNINQCPYPIITSFTCGKNSTISGTADNPEAAIVNGQVFVICNGVLSTGIVQDGKWQVELGEVDYGTEAQVCVMTNNSQPSILSSGKAGISGGDNTSIPDEEDTDISQLDNVIYLEKADLQAGSTATLSFRMKNSAAIRGFQFDLYLPDGVTVVKNSKNKIQGALSSGRLPVDDEHTLTLVEQADHAIRFLCNSEYAETFTGNEGEIATLQIQIDEGMPNGDYPFVIKNMSLNEINASVYYNHNYVQTSLTVLGGKQCAKPTISYAGGKLTFTCETEGAICHSTITDTDIASYSSNEVQLGVTYNISVYATREGYADSEVATATLCWIDAEPRTEGLAEDAVTEVKALPVLIQTQGGTISVRGIDDGMEVSAYSVDGKKEGFAISEAGQAVVNTNLTSGSTAVVKIGEKAIKVQMK